jgi:hypothetical protein
VPEDSGALILHAGICVGERRATALATPRQGDEGVANPGQTTYPETHTPTSHHAREPETPLFDIRPALVLYSRSVVG